MSYAKTLYPSEARADTYDDRQLQLRLAADGKFGSQKATIVEIECSVLQQGVPGIRIIGISEKLASDTITRIRAAFHASGFHLPAKPIAINIYAPKQFVDHANLDVPIALAILGATNQTVTADDLKDKLIYGQLSLDGIVRIAPNCASPLFAAKEIVSDNSNLKYVNCEGYALEQIALMCIDEAVRIPAL